MRTLFHHVAWALATVALVIATPVQVAADTRPLTTASATTSSHGQVNRGALGGASSAVATHAAVNAVFTSTALQPRDAGQGWAELYCMACVGLGTLALYSGGITMLPVILANPGAYGTLTGTCILACESVIKTLLR